MKTPDFTYQTANEQGFTLYDTLKQADKTFLYFSRYLGCPFCQVDILELCEQYERFTEQNAQVLLVLQSSPETIREQSVLKEPSFPIICDPDMQLYQLYQVRSAEKMSKMIRPNKKLFHKISVLLKKGLKHGKYEGNEQQLPAIFLLDRSANLLRSHQAAHISDLPDVEELLTWL